jgi:hypothetical protein
MTKKKKKKNSKKIDPINNIYVNNLMSLLKRNLILPFLGLACSGTTVICKLQISNTQSQFHIFFHGILAMISPILPSVITTGKSTTRSFKTFYQYTINIIILNKIIFT